ncbi:unnamed protein product [Auanema sp. JU1783]|nr:unnamed protein product [Auanema sp. JU1783]
MGRTSALLFSFGLLIASAESFSCKDQNNKDVDWFAAYKMPIEKENSANGIAGGTAFYYVDSNVKGALKASTETLDSKNQAIAYTLQQFYDRQKDQNVFHVMYNDEPYNTTSSFSGKLREEMIRANRLSEAASIQFGHTKGVSFFDKTSGIWLVHSVPKFPPNDHYEYPTSGHDYGQTMLCMTFKYEQLQNISTQLFYNHPDIYSSNLPASYLWLFAGKFKQGSPYSRVVTLSTIGGTSFTSFAKTNEFNNDLYDGLIAPNLRTNLKVETWRRGSEVPLQCKNQYHALDAQDIKVGDSSAFKYTKDHSKWARSVDASKPYICIGDINRMTSQFVRGGGSECISSTFLWNAFNVMQDTNSCAA